MIGVVYKFQPHNKLNGSLFYCFEYAAFLDAPLYLVGVSDKDLQLVRKVFEAKYVIKPDNLVPIPVTSLHALGLKKTLFLDIKSFYGCKEFLTNDIHVFSNEPHEMFRYQNERTVTYYGSYDYQNYDVFSYIKLNFGIFRVPQVSGNAVFVSGPYIRPDFQYPIPNKPVLLKAHDSGFGNLFELIDTVHYIHTGMDTNNRIIPEAAYFNKHITIEDLAPEIVDSVTLRYDDIMANGLENYILTNEDKMVRACQEYNN